METLLDFMLNNHDKLLYSIAAICLLIELTIIGLSGPLLFFSFGCAITGSLISLQIISGLELEILSVGLFSLLSAFFLWKPLKKMQGNGKVEDTSSDLIGQTVVVSETITHSSGTVRYSGINWSARLEQNASTDIEVKEVVVICAVNGNILIVKKAH